MPEETKPEQANSEKSAEKDAAKNRDEVALELMKFIAVTTGYGKGSAPSAGFSGKPAQAPEDYANALMKLFQLCRAEVAKPVPGSN
jgi:hypothetical protein